MGELDKDIEELWENYITTRKVEYKQKLILSYSWLIKYAIQMLNLPHNTLLQDSDYINFGILGLNDALERFEPERGVKFESYALPRIKGTIQDEMRKLDWLSRTARRKAHEFLTAKDELRSEKGREVTIEEIRQKLNLSEEEYKSYLQAVAAAKASTYISDLSSTQEEDDDFEPNEIPDHSQDNPLTSLQKNETYNFILNYLKGLSERKRLIITLYYYEDLTFKEIGNVLNVSESRVSQLHSQVIAELKKLLSEYYNA